MVPLASMIPFCTISFHEDSEGYKDILAQQSAAAVLMSCSQSTSNFSWKDSRTSNTTLVVVLSATKQTLITLSNYPPALDFPLQMQGWESSMKIC